MKKLLSFSTLLCLSLAQAVPSNQIVTFTTLEKMVKEKELYANCCYAVGCCAEVTAGIYAQNIMAINASAEIPLHHPAKVCSSLIGAGIGTCGLLFANFVCYPESKNLRNEANEYRARLAKNEAPERIIMISEPTVHFD